MRNNSIVSVKYSTHVYERDLVPFWGHEFYWNHQIIYFVAYSLVYNPINNNQIIILSHMYPANVPSNLNCAVLDWMLG